ncbi:MAG TPA: hypothetical protein VLA05_03265, partial [Coriobacteriia bacterium]|nr:hypothetical protein [Coriobacteriia bacterium]
PGAPVSVPLYWSELDGMTEQPIFTVRNLNKRLSVLSGDPWSDLSQERQAITKAMRERLGIQ